MSGPIHLFVATILLLVLPTAVRGTGLIADFESDAQLSNWTFGIGAEFPGARGSLVTTSFANSRCAELRYDFTVPAGTTSSFDPHYVTASTLVSTAQANGATRLRLRFALSSPYIKARVKIMDSGMQTLQYNILTTAPLSAQTLANWSNVIIDLSKPDRHWGGADDGVIHTPIYRIDVLVDAAEQRNTGWLRFDDVELLSPSNGIILRISNMALVPPLADLGSLAERVGVNIHFTKDDQALDLIKAAGFRWVRMDANWASIEQSVGTFNFANFDALVTTTEARSLHMLGILDYGHPVHTLGKLIPPRTPQAVKAYGAFCQAIAEHFTNRDVTFEIWNEPDIKRFWGGTPNVAEYANVLREGIDSVKRGNPTARVLTGGLCAPGNGAYLFWSGLETRGAMSGASGWGTHLYTSASAPPESRWIDILRLKDRINSVLPGQSLWCTEWGYSSTPLDNSGNGHSSSSRQAQANKVVRELLLGWWANLPLVVLYDIRDDGDDPANPEHNFGLLARDYSDKLAMTAVRTLLSMAKNRRAAGLMIAADMPNDVHILRLDGSANKLYVVWAEETALPFTLEIPSLSALVWDMYGQKLTTQVSSTVQLKTITAANGPVYIQIPN